ncbi:beta strand repeat-containing protein [Hymenobacter rubripertinctus]|nr:glycine-rich protein [Hymenobacter rubripertinctus]
MRPPLLPPGSRSRANGWLLGLCLTVGLSTAQAQTATYSLTGAPQTYTVPAGATRLRVVAQGAGFMTGPASSRPALVSAVLTVTPGEVLTVVVGGPGEQAFGSAPYTPGLGGYNGGGSGGPTTASQIAGNGGSGATDLRRIAGASSTAPLGGGTLMSTNSQRLLVAGGAGAPGTNAGEDGTGGNAGGKAGTTTGGGSGGFPASFSFSAGNSGTAGAGGAGGAGPVGGHGGGGGYFGGGGGASGGFANNMFNMPGGGGGGSSYVQPTALAGGSTPSYALATTGTGTLALTPQFVPTLAGISPASGTAGSSLLLTGTNLTGTTVITFAGTSNNTVASGFTVNADGTQISGITVPAGAQTGSVSVTTPDGTSNGVSFAVVANAVVYSLAPASGPVGTSVIITGANFVNVSRVTFNQSTSTASFVVNSATQITAVVPASATTGPVGVNNGGTTAFSAAPFTVTASAPAISSFTPSSGPVGTSVILTGTGFTGATAVAVNGTAAPGFVIDSDTQITVSIPTGASSGTISVTTPGGTGSSSTVFTVSVPAPAPACTAQVTVTPAGPVRLSGGGSVTLTAQALEPAFNTGTGFNSTAAVTAVQPDGKILAAGTTTYNGTPTNNLVRLNPDGTIDASFTQPGTGLNGSVRTILLQPDGKILVAGAFTSYNGTARKLVARLNADGSLDATFRETGTGISGTISSGPFDIGPGITDMALQPDGKVLVAGAFSNYNGTARVNVARLNADGSLDAGFAPTPTSFTDGANVVVVQPNGKILLGGSFRVMNGGPQSGAVVRRFNADGTTDGSFQPVLSSNVDANVQALALQADGKFLLGGSFNVGPFTTARYLERRNADGSLDAGFPTGGPNFSVAAVQVQADGKLVLGGLFTSYAGTARGRLARLNPDGTLDNGFATGAGFNSNVRALTLQADGKLLATGTFTSYNGSPATRIARLNPDGSLNDTATPIAGATYAWSNGQTGASITVDQAGSYSATASYGSGCTATSRAVQVTADTTLTNLIVSTAQTISGSYNNVTITGTGAATLGAALQVAGTLTVQAGGSLVTNCQPVTGAGSFVLAAGGTLSICDAAGISSSGATGAVQLAGSRTFSPTATYRYAGTQAQTTGSGLPAQVRNLEVGNAAGLTLTQPLSVGRELRLTTGNLTLNGRALTLLSSDTLTALVVNTNGQVNGPATVQRYLSPALNPGPGYRHLAAPVLRVYPNRE